MLREKVQLRRLDWLVPEGAPVAAALLDRGRQCCIVCVDRPVDGRALAERVVQVHERLAEVRALGGEHRERRLEPSLALFGQSQVSDPGVRL